MVAYAKLECSAASLFRDGRRPVDNLAVHGWADGIPGRDGRPRDHIRL